MINWHIYFERLSSFIFVKGLVTELAPPHVQSTWGSRRENVRTARLAACCNYFSKKTLSFFFQTNEEKKKKNPSKHWLLTFS